MIINNEDALLHRSSSRWDNSYVVRKASVLHKKKAILLRLKPRIRDLRAVKPQMYLSVLCRDDIYRSGKCQLYWKYTTRIRLFEAQIFFYLSVAIVLVQSTVMAWLDIEITFSFLLALTFHATDLLFLEYSHPLFQSLLST